MRTSTPVKRRGRGRPVEHRLGDIIAAINLLTQAGSLVNVYDMAHLLALDEVRAAEILEQLCGQHGDTTTPLLPLCSTQIEGEYMRIDAPGSAKFKPLRLTPKQAAECTLALDELGLGCSNTLRTKIVEDFYPQGAEGLPEPKPRETSLEIGKALELCARSLAQAKRADNEVPSATAPVVTFKYQGANDKIVRTRNVVPTAIHCLDSSWIVEAFDLDARAARTFRASLMKECALTGTSKTISLDSQDRPDGGTVELLCTPEAAAKVLTWDGAKIVEQKGKQTLIRVPYFRGDWLPRHVLALGSSISYKSPTLHREVRAIAQENLKRAASL